MPESAANMMKIVRWVFVIIWTFYATACIMPAALPTADGVVARQLLLTAADIVAKVIYRVMITKVGMDLSKAEGCFAGLAEAGLANAE